MPGPAYRIVTERLVVRCWDPADAAPLKTSIDSSIEHLRRWMPWAVDEPEPVAAKVARLRRFRALFDADEDYIYGIFDRETSGVVGGTGLHTRVGGGGREIGYWVRADREGEGLISESVAALVKVAFELDGVTWVEIRVDPDNVRSAAVPVRLGFAEEARLAHRIADANGTPRDVVVYTMLRDVYRGSVCAATWIEAYGAGGERLL
jgi:RimJ/RimL family protein N-acetyltransferase